MSDDSTSIIFESDEGPSGVADVEDIALAALHLAYDVAAHSNDPDYVMQLVIAHEAVNGEMAATVTRQALVGVVALLEQLITARPGLANFTRPEFRKQAETFGNQRRR